jgi:hypothetical protein
MTKRKIDFTGPSVQELGLEINNNNATIGNAINGNTNNTSTVYGNTKKNNVYVKLIRDYLNAALGNKERAEIKLSVMVQELGINPKTLYKHLLTLRVTEFTIKKLRYSTEIKRKQ